MLRLRGSCLKIFQLSQKTCNGDFVIGTYSLPASAEGRVEYQKLNQTAPYNLFGVRWNTFFQVNRVEHQKLNQTTPYGAVWLSFWCSTRPSADPGN